MAIEESAGFYIEGEVRPNTEVGERIVDGFIKEQSSKQIPIGIDLDLEDAKKQIGDLLKNNIEGIPKNFELIKREISRVKTGAFKGLIQSVETFSDGANEARQRIIIFGRDANGELKAVDGTVQKSVEHLNNYQQAMELTAKKLSTVRKETERVKEFDENGKWTGAWKTVNTTLMSSGQELRTVVTEMEKFGIATKKVHQEIRKFDKETGELIEDWHQFGSDSTEITNLREQAEEKFINTLLKEKNVLEESHRYQTTLKKDILDDNGKTLVSKGTKIDTTIKTTTDQYGTTYQKIIRKWQDDLGNTIEQVNAKIKEQGKKWTDLGVISKKITSDEIKDQEKNKNKIKDKITTMNSYKRLVGLTSHQIEEESIVTKDLNGNMKEVSKTTDTFTDAQGRLVTQITKVDEKGQHTTETLIKMGNSTKHLGQSFTDVIVKVAKFYVASLPIRAVQNAITQAIEGVKEFDSALTEFKKVSDLSGKSLDEYTEKLERLGSATARTKTEMTQMATEFKKSGYTDEEAATLAQTASLYQNIADEELSASDASSVLISQMKAFKFEANEAEHVIDAINEV